MVIKGLFKLHFVVVLSCAVVGNIFSVGEEITLVSSDGREFVIQVADNFFEASDTLQNVLSFFDMMSELPKSDELAEPDEKMKIYIDFSSEALELLIRCSAFDQMQMNELALVQKRDSEFAEAINLANYLDLGQVAKFLIEATSAVVTNKDAKRISAGLDRDMRVELQKAQSLLVLRGALTTQEKRARKKIQKRQSIERRRALDEKIAFVEVY